MWRGDESESELNPCCTLSEYLLCSNIYLHRFGPVFECILFNSVCMFPLVGVSLHVHVCCLLSTYKLTVMCICVCVTFSLGGHFERCRALARPVAVVSHDSEAIFGVWHQILDGDLHLSWTAGIHNPLSDVQTQSIQYI